MGEIQLGRAWMWPYHVGTKKEPPAVGGSRPLFPGAQKKNRLLVLIQYEWGVQTRLNGGRKRQKETTRRQERYRIPLRSDFLNVTC